MGEPSSGPTFSALRPGPWALEPRPVAPGCRWHCQPRQPRCRTRDRVLRGARRGDAHGPRDAMDRRRSARRPASRMHRRRRRRTAAPPALQPGDGARRGRRAVRTGSLPRGRGPLGRRERLRLAAQRLHGLGMTSTAPRAYGPWRNFGVAGRRPGRQPLVPRPDRPPDNMDPADARHRADLCGGVRRARRVRKRTWFGGDRGARPTTLPP